MTTLAYADRIIPGRAGYAPTNQLSQAYQDGRVACLWALGTRIVSIQLTKTEGGGIWKARERLPLSAPDSMLDALESVGVRHPSSFADCYHQLAPKAVRLPWTVNGIFHWWPGGPWEEARLTGEHRGKWYRYDLISAYRWAATLGLPDPLTYTVEENPRGRLKCDRAGLWLYQVKGRAPTQVPAIYRNSALLVLSSEEIEAYRIRGEAIRGVTWEKCLPLDYVEQTLRRLPCHKPAGRAYWGRWVARDRLTCRMGIREWELPNIGNNFVWGWLIVGRVRLRLWQASQEAAHVYVDEIVVPHTMTTGQNLGDWHLKEEYPRGVAVYRTGWYGPLGSTTPTMQTGVIRQ